MGVFDGMKEKLAEWFFLKEWPIFVRAAGLFVVGHLTQGHTGDILKMFGVSIDPSTFINAFVTVGTGAAVVGALHMGWAWIAKYLASREKPAA